jgi:hypothetical protein
VFSRSGFKDILHERVGDVILMDLSGIENELHKKSGKTEN